jgi:hypothetical protein
MSLPVKTKNLAKQLAASKNLTLIEYIEWLLMKDLANGSDGK